MSATAWAAVAVFAFAYALIATEKIHRVAAALGGAVVMLLIGATDAEHAFFSEEAGIDWNVIFLLVGMMLIVSVLKRTGAFEYVNAGHLPPYIRRADGVLERLDDEAGGGLALGMFEAASYSPQHAELRPGDTLIVYSDGITEAENPARRPFDDAGLEAVIAAHGELDPEPLGRAILFAVERHAGDAKLGDDLTALVVRRSLAATGRV